MLAETFACSSSNFPYTYQVSDNTIIEKTITSDNSERIRNFNIIKKDERVIVGYYNALTYISTVVINKKESMVYKTENFGIKLSGGSTLGYEMKCQNI